MKVKVLPVGIKPENCPNGVYLGQTISSGPSTGFDGGPAVDVIRGLPKGADSVFCAIPRSVVEGNGRLAK